MTARTSSILSLVVLSSSLALAQSAGVSDERSRLPGAPGSISGVGENSSVEGNQGALSQRVPIDVPEGFEGLTPEYSLSYSSSGGASVVGMGWSLPELSIERMTSKGLQRYDANDRFVANGSIELVRVSPGVYRARYEGGFVRYTWLGATQGQDGYWKAEYPDGRVGWFGAYLDTGGTPTADPVAQVREASTTRVFRWQLCVMVDRYGHQMKLTWTKEAGGTPLLDRADYVYDAGVPRYSLRFTYEARPDTVSDARPGFELKLTQRVRNIQLVTASEVTRAWVLDYEDSAVSGGASRLKSVKRFGRGYPGTQLLYPVTFSFGYSQTLLGSCTGDGGCTQPFRKDMGQIVGFSTGRATLIDMNGDALPDVVASTDTGVHTIYLAQLGGDGQVTFAPTGTPSARTVGGSPFILGSPTVQVFDVNGDGFVDITRSRPAAVLCNNGSGDWQPESYCVAPVADAGALDVDDVFSADDPDDGAPGTSLSDALGSDNADPLHVRFFDYDNDRRVDRMLTAATNTTVVLANRLDGYVPENVDPVGAMFDDEALQLADMNGDGLQDPVLLVTASGSPTVTGWYKLNLGWGRWSATVPLTATFAAESQADQAELQDVNGDGLADLVSVVDGAVLVALNRNGGQFEAVRELLPASVQGGLPTRATGTLVSFADMNGNGSDDLVYIQPDGSLSYVELFPVRPNLVSRIENGLGSVQLITYGTSIAEQARDTAAGAPWLYRVPNAYTVVKQTVRYVTLTGSESGGLRETTQYSYHSGAYDGVEKQFAGYEQVEVSLNADASNDAREAGLTVNDFSVGVTNPLFAGELVRERVYAMPGKVPLRERRFTNEACAAAQTTGAPLPITFSCARAVDTIIIDRDPSKALTLRTERDYDGYGNVTETRELGVVNNGTPEAPTACTACVASGLYGAACGAQCLGDERYTATTYIAPGTASTGDEWILNRAAVMTSTAAPGVIGTETRTFYDGAAFTGLPTGQLTRGTVTRVSRRFGAGNNDFIDVSRFELDSHGNVATELEPTAAAADATKGRTMHTYDTAGVLEVATEQLLGGAEVSSLRRTAAFDLAYGELSQASNWVPWKDGAALGNAQLTRYRYDEHGRLVRVLDPGNSDESKPDQSFAWLLGDPSSRVEVRQRSIASGAEDVVTARCFDGRGRLYQVLDKLDANRWQSNGFVAFDSQGATVRAYQPYVSTSGACDAAPPQGVLSTAFKFDAVGRPTTTTFPDSATLVAEYAPLTVTETDQLGHQVVRSTDGLNRLVSLSRLGLSAPVTSSFDYDAAGFMLSATDAAGKKHRQTFDALGRLVRVDDPNSGVTTVEYDAASQETRRTTADGAVTRTAYDAQSRRIAEWSETDEAGTRRQWVYDYVPGCAECTNAGGKVARVSWPGATAGGSESLGYDAKELPVYRQRTQGGVSFVFRTQYDAADRAVATIFPGDLSIDRGFDGSGRVTSITNVVSAFTYDDRGDLSGATYANGATASWGYDAVRRLTSHTARGADDAEFLKLTYTRDAKGLVTGIGDGQLADRAHHAMTFTRDALDRTLTAQLSADETLSWSYDAIDNITSITSSRGAQSQAHVGTLDYGTRPNAVLNAGSLSLGYDGAGRLTERGAVALTRDYKGRVINANGGRVDGAFTWGAVDRVEAIEGDSTVWYLGGDFELRDGIAAAYVRVDGTRVARLESDALASTVLTDLSADSRIDIADAWLAQADAKNVKKLPTGTSKSALKALLMSAARRQLLEDTTWLHSDALGSLIAATDADGKVRGEQSFLPTGLARDEQGYVDEYGFTGQERDVSTGLLHFRFRELDALTGRWDQPDPNYFALNQGNVEDLGEATSAYAYVGNDFADKYDPNGLKSSSGGKAAKKDKKTTGKSKSWLSKKSIDKKIRPHAHKGNGTTADSGANASAPTTPSVSQGWKSAQRPTSITNTNDGSSSSGSSSTATASSSTTETANSGTASGTTGGGSGGGSAADSGKGNWATNMTNGKYLALFAGVGVVVAGVIGGAVAMNVKKPGDDPPPAPSPTPGLTTLF